MQSDSFKFGRGKEKEDRTKIVMLVVSQPALPNVDYKSGARNVKRMAIQHNFEVCNLMRIHTAASTTKMSNIKMSETGVT